MIRIASLVAVLAMFVSTSLSAAEPLKPSQQWSGFYPVKQLTLLPAKQQKSPVGAIQDMKTWQAIFQALQPEMETPKIDFEKQIVVFARNTRFVNRILGLSGQLDEGTLTIRYASTRTARPIVDQLFMVVAVFPRDGIEKISNGQQTVPLTQAAPAADKLEVVFTVPNPLWSLQIQRVYVRPKKNVIVVCTVTQGKGLAAQVISEAKDAVTIKDLPDLPRLVVIHGKSWKWKNKEPYRYSKAADIALVYKSIEGLGGGQLIYQRDERPLKE